MTEQIPETMRAALLLGSGGPEMIEVRDDVPVPRPGTGEVLVRVGACGVNNTDINTRTGWYSRAVTSGTSGDGHAESDVADATWGRSAPVFPRIQGADPSGIVAAVGDGVDRSILGRRALIDPWMRDPEHPEDRSRAGYLGSEVDGGFAEYCRVPVSNVHTHRSRRPHRELAALPCSWSTAEHMLQRVRLAAGETIVVPGASGGVGSALVALSKLRGARVIAVCGESKIDQVASLGADTIVPRELTDVAGAVAEAASGRVDVVADVVGGPAFGEWLEALRRGGRYVTAGAIAGPVVPLDMRTMYLKDLELHGATVFEPSVFADLVSYLERGEISPVVHATYPLEAIGEAQAAFETKTHVGAIVIVVDAGLDPAPDLD